MDNRQLVTLLVSNGFITKTEFAREHNIEYKKLMDTLSGRKKSEDVLRALQQIGVQESDLPID